MQLTSRQHQVLDDLGITVWKRRETSAVKSASVEMEIQPEATVDISGALLLVMADTELNDDKQRLLGAMLKSVALTLEQVSLVDASEFAQLSAQLMTDKLVLLIGNVAEPVSQRCYSCPDLDQMLQQPELKATAWQALKQLKTAF